ncbi:hypothetical protein GS896_25750 [Rhodococcus hoagii]|nr:hypothetical protein [Prescottella equi]MBM4654089.1 hypothetical protein [Prescottella equi]NKR23362.1 hypothetical protein [Prescottella equi]NKT56027.1 hypothetical protein [Prescottella equi]NKU37349.1 hypothetical protein [Prescottella equi]
MCEDTLTQDPTVPRRWALSPDLTYLELRQVLGEVSERLEGARAEEAARFIDLNSASDEEFLDMLEFEIDHRPDLGALVRDWVDLPAAIEACTDLEAAVFVWRALKDRQIFMNVADAVDKLLQLALYSSSRANQLVEVRAAAIAAGVPLTPELLPCAEMRD